jgi:hypothetical protein
MPLNKLTHSFRLTRRLARSAAVRYHVAFFYSPKRKAAINVAKVVQLETTKPGVQR